jgi:hypothetical protein
MDYGASYAGDVTHLELLDVTCLMSSVKVSSRTYRHLQLRPHPLKMPQMSSSSGSAKQKQEEELKTLLVTELLKAKQQEINAAKAVRGVWQYSDCL